MKTTTGPVVLINLSMVVKCGGVVVGNLKKPLDANLTNILIRKMKTKKVENRDKTIKNSLDVL